MKDDLVERLKAGVEKDWRTVAVPGEFNRMALCTQCGLHAGETVFTRYVEQAIAKGPYCCDGCLVIGEVE